MPNDTKIRRGSLVSFTPEAAPITSKVMGMVTHVYEGDHGHFARVESDGGGVHYRLLGAFKLLAQQVP